MGRLWSVLMRLLRDRRGATSLERVLLIGAIVLPGYVIVRIGLDTLMGHYGLLQSLTALPFP